MYYYAFSIYWIESVLVVKSVAVRYAEVSGLRRYDGTMMEALHSVDVYDIFQLLVVVSMSDLKIGWTCFLHKYIGPRIIVKKLPTTSHHYLGEVYPHKVTRLKCWWVC